MEEANNKPLGTWGDIGTFSFDFAKTITTGEGMLSLKIRQSMKKQQHGMIMDTR